jgi:hypothetical protein
MNTTDTEDREFRALVRLTLPELCARYVAEVPADVRETYNHGFFTKANYALVILECR